MNLLGVNLARRGCSSSNLWTNQLKLKWILNKMTDIDSKNGFSFYENGLKLFENDSKRREFLMRKWIHLCGFRKDSAHLFRFMVDGNDLLPFLNECHSIKTVNALMSAMIDVKRPDTALLIFYRLGHKSISRKFIKTKVTFLIAIHACVATKDLTKGVAIENHLKQIKFPMNQGEGELENAFIDLFGACRDWPRAWRAISSAMTSDVPINEIRLGVFLKTCMACNRFSMTVDLFESIRKNN